MHQICSPVTHTHDDSDAAADWNFARIGISMLHPVAMLFQAQSVSLTTSRQGPWRMRDIIIT